MVSPIPQPSLSEIAIENVKEGETVHQRFLLVNGRAGPRTEKHDGTIIVVHNDFPQQKWPCVDSYFKALVHLVPGPNTLTLLFLNKQLHFHINYVPLLQNPPLSLVIFLGKDSPGTFDVPPHKQDQNTLEVAVEKLRMAGYMWQAFYAEQMYRSGMGRRTFRLDEAWLPDTVSSQDKGTKRQTAQVYTFRSKYTVAEIRKARSRKGKDRDHKDLFSFVLEGLEQTAPFNTASHIAALVLDSHWDPKNQVVLGHTARSDSDVEIPLGVFGSHALHACPGSIEEIVPCMMDDTLNDTRYVCNYGNGDCQSWKSLNMAMSRMLHTVGSSLTLTHTPTGIMSEGYTNLNRAFMVKEPGTQLTPLNVNVSRWHRADVVRLRLHPAFRIPQDGPVGIKAGPYFSPLSSNQIQVTAPAGLAMIELFVNGQCTFDKECLDQQPTTIQFSLQEIYQLCECGVGNEISIQVTCVNHTKRRIENITEFLTYSLVPGMSGGAIKGVCYGGPGGEHSFSKLIYENGHPKQLKEIHVHHGDFIDGFELMWQDGTYDRVGRYHGNPSRFGIQNGEFIQGCHIAHHDYIEGIQFILSSGRLSRWYGPGTKNVKTIAAPKGYHLVGFYGRSGFYIDRIGGYFQPNE